MVYVVAPIEPLTDGVVTLRLPAVEAGDAADRQPPCRCLHARRQFQRDAHLDVDERGRSVLNSPGALALVLSGPSRRPAGDP
jgi:hypothetical protein